MEGATRARAVMPDLKAFATLQARAALSGLSCHCTTLGNIVIARFGGSWIFGTAEEASAWLDRVDGDAS